MREKKKRGTTILFSCDCHFLCLWMPAIPCLGLKLRQKFIPLGPGFQAFRFRQNYIITFAGSPAQRW